MIYYHKLVRDKIPEIIKDAGEVPLVRILEDEEYRTHLGNKLDEEVAEFHKDQNLEELADILEVVYALADTIGSRQELEEIYRKKHGERGGFRKKVYLIGKEIKIT